MNRIALVHFTAHPAVGGVEQLLESQCTALTRLGYAVRVIVGTGSGPPETETRQIPLLDPNNSAVCAARVELQGGLPTLDDPTVLSIQRDLIQQLGQCDQCWVHNLFTVYLNPFATVALAGLTQKHPELHWVGWCQDLTCLSSYVAPDLAQVPAHIRLSPDVKHVAISHARQGQLSSVLGIDGPSIWIIQPPLDVDRWLELGTRAQLLAEKLCLREAEPVILVPSKLLPHKRLDRAIHLAAALRDRYPRTAILLTAAASSHEGSVSARVKLELHDLAHRHAVSDLICFIPEILSAHVDRGTVRDLMLLSDLVFVPSDEEGFGMPVSEAAALRVPVVCTDIDSFRESGGEFATYFSASAGPRELADLVCEVLDSPACQARRRTIRSMDLFTDQIRRLLSAINSP